MKFYIFQYCLNEWDFKCKEKKNFGWWLKKKEKNSFFRWSRKHFLLKENLNFGSNQYLIIDNSEMFCLLDFFFYAKPDIHVQKLLKILWLRHRWFRKDHLTMSIQLLILRKIEYQPYVFTEAYTATCSTRYYTE